MFSFAKTLVKTLEHTAESVISGGPQDESILDSDSYFAHTRHCKAGLRVLHVQSGSAADQAGLQSWFDFVIGINGHELPTGYDEHYQLMVNYEYLFREIANCAGRSVVFDVWSAKGGVLRSVEIEIKAKDMDDIPLNTDDSAAPKFEQLGMKLQWTPIIASTFVYHVLEIHRNSPAERAGLIEHSDYIIGAQDGLLATGGEDLLGRLIASKRDSSLILYVYNHDYDVVRPVTITPVDNWGGNGLLGCGVGYGLLHRIPAVTGSYEPGSVLFDGSQQEQPEAHFQPIQPIPQLAVQPPAMQSTTPISPVAAPPPVHRKKKNSVAPKSGLLDYLQEESEKSRKLDGQGRTSTTTADTLPPPPKK